MLKLSEFTTTGYKTKFFFICIFFLSAFSVSAADYYVAKTGNDNNTGTEIMPWQTLKKAGKTAIEGDNVYVKAGVYKAPLYPRNSGTETNYITFKTYGTDEVIIDGGYAVTGWSLHSGNIYKASWDSSFLDSIKSPAEGFVNIDSKYDEDHLLRSRATMGEMTSGSWYYDITAKLLYVWLNDSSDPSNHTVYSTTTWNNSFGILVMNGHNYLKFQGFKIRLTFQGIELLANHHHVEFKDIEISGSGHDAVRIAGTAHNIEFDNMNIHHNKGHAIQLNCSYGSVTNSRLFRNGIVSWSRWGGCGIDMLGDNNTIANNQIYENGFGGCFGVGIMLESFGTWGELGPDTCHHNTIEQNRIYRNRGAGIDISGADNNKITKNLIYENELGITIYKGLSGSKSPTEIQKIAENNNIYNNSIANSKSVGLKMTQDAKRNTILNNIFYLSGQIEIYVDDATKSNILNYNNYFSKGDFPFKWLGVSYKTLSEYQNISNQDSASITSNPEFSDLTEYMPLSGSSVIDKGKILDLPYKGMAPDIGAVESDYGSLEAPNNLRIL